MPTLYVLSGPEVGKSFSVRSGDTVGRSPDRIVTLRHASVSRKHAHLEHVPGEGSDGVWYLIDDGSQNGLSFEGERTERVALHDAAEVTLGEIKLRFRLEAPSVPAPAPVAEDSGLDEIELEDEEIFLEGPDDTGDAAGLGATVPRPITRPASELPAPKATAPKRTKPSKAKGEPVSGSVSDSVLQYHKVDASSGADLSQYPGWVRAALVLFALALAGGVAYLSFRGTFFVKQQVSDGPIDFELGDVELGDDPVQEP